MRPYALLFAAVLAVSACGSQPGGSSEDLTTAATPGAETGAGEPVTAVTTVFPLAWLAGQIAPDAEVTFIGSGGQDPHDLELSPADRAAFEQAQVVLYMGEIDFQPQVETAVSSAGGVVVSATDVAGEDALLSFGGEKDDHAEGDDHAEDDDHADDDGHAHADEGIDPHLWFDAAVMADVAEAVGAAFAEADPAGGEDYVRNAAAAHDELLELDGQIDALLADCAQDHAIVSHEAYAYLLEPRGFHQEGISGAGAHAGADPQRIAELVEELEAESITVVLTEPIEGREDAEAVAREADVELLDIYSLDIVTEEQQEQGYPTLLRQQAEAFATALDCG